MTGRCLCGSIRYQVPDDAAAGTSLCHCEDCRRASGAPAVAWTFFPAGTLEWTYGQPKSILWEGRVRSFCSDCGTPLTFFDPELPDQFEVSTCSLDRPEEHKPRDHNWESDRLPWFLTADDLPRYPQNSPPPG